MAVPSKKDLHRPILEIAAETEGSVHRRKIFDYLIQRLNLTTDDLADRSMSGSRRFYDRASFAMHDLQLSGFLLAPERGYRQITDEGRRFLQTHEGAISDWALRQRQTQLQPNRGSDGSGGIAVPDAGDSNQNASPSEIMDVGFRQLQSKLIDDMLESVMGVSSDRFEWLVVNLLERMGYGEGQAVGRSGDGGIDGIINQDALGLEKVYVQAKRWAAPVGEPEIRNFSGSLDPYGATKGVFITTSTFSNTARQTARNISAGNKFIRLVDGDELARLMIRYGVGVVTEYTYEVKKLDENYFAEDV